MSEYTGPERRGNGGGFTFSKSLNLSHLFVTVTMVFGGISYVSGIDTKVQLLETKLLSLERSVDKSEARAGQEFNELKTAIQRLGTKIDRLTIRG
jgi:hypothetical protein